MTKFLSEDKANDLRGRVCGILRKPKLPQDNLSKPQRKALNELKHIMSDGAILPADKAGRMILISFKQSIVYA